MKSETTAYPALRRQIAGLSVAGLVAWTLDVLLWAAAQVASGIFSGDARGYLSEYIPVLPAMLLLNATFGIPWMLLVCVACGLPAWALARRGSLSVRGAAITGAGAGLAIWAISVLRGLATRLDPEKSYGSGWLGWMVVDDGLPTALGWAFEALDAMGTAAVGAVAGIVAFRVAMGGQRRRKVNASV